MKMLKPAKINPRWTTRAASSRFHTSRVLSSVTGSAASKDKQLRSILIANRGEIALRVGRTASQYGIRTTTIFTDPDAHSLHALSSPFAVNLGQPTAYLDGDAIIEVAKNRKCDSIHPGYGFLSENSSFARKCSEAGLIFIGPGWEAIEAMGNKSRSKEIMTAAGVPCIPGYHGSNQDPELLLSEAEKIGFPVLLKAVKGGGGKGMRISHSAQDFQDQLVSAKSEARNSFGDDAMLVEKFITVPRHIEVQIFADKHGNCVALGERDCSIQRRHQKIIEESPAPNLDDSIRKDLWAKARDAALAVNYEGAGTVEFIFDNLTGEFFFMEMNTRLQVEHPVTEMVTGQDLVRWQFLVAEGKSLPLTQEEVEDKIRALGWAFEARIYAENPEMNFIPDSGKLQYLQTPPISSEVRIDAGFTEGDEISSHYDPMIAKLIVRGPTRIAALQKLNAALEAYEIAGPITNIEFLKRICESPGFVAGEVETGYIEKYRADLFSKTPVPDDAWAQAALGILLQETSTTKARNSLVSNESVIGFGGGYQSRTFNLSRVQADGSSDTEVAHINIHQISTATFDINVNGTSYRNVQASLTSPTKVQSLFPHTRLDTTVIRSEDMVTVFQNGKMYRVRFIIPAWVEKTLGMTDVTNSILAPMPCKILRVDVAEGEDVKKDQALLVIESMKMETVIRSPQNGVVSKIIHKAGDICKSGTALVEFESPSD